jgi:hypothetical protein
MLGFSKHINTMKIIILKIFRSLMDPIRQSMIL